MVSFTGEFFDLSHEKWRYLHVVQRGVEFDGAALRLLVGNGKAFDLDGPAF